MTEKEIQEKARAIAQEHEKYTEDCRIHLHHEGKSEVDVARETAYAAAIEMADFALSNQWVNVKDKLPERKERYSKYVIMRNRIGGHYIGCYDFVAELWFDGNLEMIYMDITHWMPIPPLAEEGGEK